MHRVPLARRSDRTVDPERVCAAAGTLEDLARTRRWAALLAVLGEPGRLSLVLALHAGEELCVSDLVVATGQSRTGVSHALRLLRAHGVVEVRRDSRLARYRLADPVVQDVLAALGVRVHEHV